MPSYHLVKPWRDVKVEEVDSTHYEAWRKVITLLGKRIVIPPGAAGVN